MTNLYNGFDYFGFYETPTMTLCNPNKKTLHILDKLKDRRLQLNLSAISTFSFTAFEYLDGKKNEYYNDLQSKRLVHIDDIGYFIIVSCNETSYGFNSTKEIVANSLEFELARKKVDLKSGTYKFYDPLNVENSLLGMVLKPMFTWTIGEVDEDLWDIWKEYSYEDNNIYNYLMTNVSEAVECIFTFDIENRKVHATSAKNIISKTNIYMSHKNLIDNVKITEKSDELCTMLSVSGGNNLSIDFVNPLGYKYIYNFNYYKNLNWMSQELIDAINTWEKRVNDNKDYHTSLITRRYEIHNLLKGATNNADDSGLFGERTWLEQDLANLEVLLASKIQSYTAFKNSSTSEDIQKSIQEIKGQMSQKKAELQLIQKQIDELESE